MRVEQIDFDKQHRPELRIRNAGPVIVNASLDTLRALVRHSHPPGPGARPQHDLNALLRARPASAGMTAILIVSLLVAATCTRSQAQAQPDPDEVMKRYAAAGTPGENHKILDVFAGTWTIRTTSWPEGQGKPPILDSATAEMSWINGGRFIHQTVRGTQFGAPFEAVSIFGYNNIRKKYVGVWIDNSSTTPFITEGTAREEGRVIDLYGTSDDPGGGCTTGRGC